METTPPFIEPVLLPLPHHGEAKIGCQQNTAIYIINQNKSKNIYFIEKYLFTYMLYLMLDVEMGVPDD